MQKTPEEEEDVVHYYITILFTRFLLVNTNKTITKKLSKYLPDITNLWSYNWIEGLRTLTFSKLDECRDSVRERENGGRRALVYTVDYLAA